MSEQDSFANEDSDDEFDWEEVEMPLHQPQEHQDFEITLQTRPKPDAVKSVHFKTMKNRRVSDLFAEIRVHPTQKGLFA